MRCNLNGVEKVLAVAGGMKPAPINVNGAALIAPLKSPDEIMVNQYEVWMQTDRTKPDMLILAVDNVHQTVIGVSLYNSSNIVGDDTRVTITYSGKSKYMSLLNWRNMKFSDLFQKLSDPVINRGEIEKKLYKFIFGKSMTEKKSKEKEELEKKIKELDKLASDMSKIASDNRALKRELSESEAKRSNAESFCQSARNEVIKIKSAADKKDTEIQRLTKLNSEYADKITSLTEDAEVRTEINVALEEENNKLKTDVATLEERISDLNKDNSYLKDSISKMTDHQHDLKMEILNKKIEYLMSLCGELDELQKAQLHIIELTTELEFMKSSKTTKTTVVEKHMEVRAPKEKDMRLDFIRCIADEVKLLTESPVSSIGDLKSNESGILIYGRSISKLKPDYTNTLLVSWDLIERFAKDNSLSMNTIYKYLDNFVDQGIIRCHGHNFSTEQKSKYTHYWKKSMAYGKKVLKETGSLPVSNHVAFKRDKVMEILEKGHF